MQHESTTKKHILYNCWKHKVIIDKVQEIHNTFNLSFTPYCSTLMKTAGVNTPSSSCCSDPDQQHHRGHQQPLGDPRPHGGRAEERDGDPEHHHRGPASEGLGALPGSEELHHIRRSVKKKRFRSWLWGQKNNVYLTWLVPKWDNSVFLYGLNVSLERNLKSPSTPLVGLNPLQVPLWLAVCVSNKHSFPDLQVKRHQDVEIQTFLNVFSDRSRKDFMGNMCMGKNYQHEGQTKLNVQWRHLQVLEVCSVQLSRRVTHDRTHHEPYLAVSIRNSFGWKMCFSKR